MHRPPHCRRLRLSSLVLGLFLVASLLPAAELPRIVVAPDKRGFVTDPGGKAFVPWGLNYDHDARGRLIEDYWDAEWGKVERDFRAMRALGANVVRVHLQVGKFLDGPARPNAGNLARLAKLVRLAEETGLYLDLTGLGCYHRADVPAWYDALDEAARWDAQAVFWQAVAEQCAASPAVFCYDLMNEPVVPGGQRKPGDWLGPPFAGKHFVQVISLDQRDRPRPEIARQWIRRLTTAIRTQDKRRLITVGLVDWSLDRPGLTSGFVPDKIAGELDFLCVHLYPERGKVADAITTLKGFCVGKPVVIEETFPLKCSRDECAEFIRQSRPHAAGWCGFYWGQTPEELRRSTTIADAMLREHLEFFQQQRPAAK